jgi:uncharacterized protein with PIN domain
MADRRHRFAPHSRYLIFNHSDTFLLLTRLDLYGVLRPFTRCLRCNGELEDVVTETVLH